VHDLGDVIPLSIEITNAAGTPEDAGSVSVTITLPDGTTANSGALSSTSAGVYDYDYPTTQAGRHAYRWVATGTNASVYEDVFDVLPADPLAFIGLADTKEYMKKTDTRDDEKLRAFIQASCAMIVERVGHVTPLEVTEDRSGCRTIVLRKRPVLEVVSVQKLPGLATVAEADLATGTAGWVAEEPARILRHTSGYFGDVRITYRVGRVPTPGHIRTAGYELVAHLWRTSQLNSGGGRPPLSDMESPVIPGAAFALPIRVRELLGLGKDMFGDEVLIA
jgi:hypothetical protein